MLPQFYQTHLKSQLNLADYIFLKILLHLLQLIKKVNLENLEIIKSNFDSKLFSHQVNDIPHQVQ